ncbi:methylase of polypeptide subunit release factors [Neisseria sp. HSC-16F19]|nr:class I SAM-dependent methyltransferase [Neisseria sp. HSC-16F19]MCP2041284.1 methylase of polypeptide subunit release factors [Neisseria sp. HSC-16F19]
MLSNIIPFAHSVLADHIAPGDTVVDATAGNGHDALFLARCVGEGGRVYAFDIQAAALQATQAHLAEAGCGRQAVLVGAGHETLAQHVSGPIAAAVFNCGYLPGGDKRCITTAAATLSGLRQALALLQPQGVVAAVLYPGHAGGDAEAEAVCAWAASLPQQQYAVLRYEFINRTNNPPFLLVIEKRTV